MQTLNVVQLGTLQLREWHCQFFFRSTISLVDPLVSFAPFLLAAFTLSVDVNASPVQNRKPYIYDELFLLILKMLLFCSGSHWFAIHVQKTRYEVSFQIMPRTVDPVSVLLYNVQLNVLYGINA